MSLQTSKKKKAMEFWKSSTASTPEKRQYVEKHFHLTPTSQSRLFANKEKFSTARKCLFRVAGAGRPVGETWAKIEEKLLEKFTRRREMGILIHKRHLMNYVFEICSELQINLAVEGSKNGWRATPKLLCQQIDWFCKNNDITMKRASRQLHKKPKVNFFLA